MAERETVEDAPVVIVTGVGGNLGSAFARLFLERGHRVVAIDQSAEYLTWIGEDPRVVQVAGDVTEYDVNLSVIGGGCATSHPIQEST
jgi:meso-butanediol dehydrogenase/(S,S)-butanediol dehydrogenase/diacetyl reductase